MVENLSGEKTGIGSPWFDCLMVRGACLKRLWRLSCHASESNVVEGGMYRWNDLECDGDTPLVEDEYFKETMGTTV